MAEPGIGTTKQEHVGETGHSYTQPRLHPVAPCVSQRHTIASHHLDTPVWIGCLKTGRKNQYIRLVFGLVGGD
jgi:hypothetical protein